MKEKIKKKDCEKLFKRWKKIQKKFPKAQRITTEAHFKEQPPISNKGRKEFYTLAEELKNKCLDFLSPAERNELER